MAKPEHFIEVGVTALRNMATGEFLPAVPLYIEADDSAAAAVEKLEQDLGKLLAQRMRMYKEQCAAAGIVV